MPDLLDDLQEALLLPEAAKVLRYSAQSMHRLRAEGKLPSFKVAAKV